MKLLLAAGMDDQDVAARLTRDVLADAAAEQPLEKARFAGADDDQPGLTVLGGVDKLLRRLPGDASEFDLQVSVGEEKPAPARDVVPTAARPASQLDRGRRPDMRRTASDRRLRGRRPLRAAPARRR